MKLYDIKDMPGFDDVKVKNGIDSVTTGKVFWTDKNLVTCYKHGAMNAVSEDCKIWRCLMCNQGAYFPDYATLAQRQRQTT